MYWAPEFDSVLHPGSQHRGRAVDIFALGCIFLEIASILVGPLGSHAKFAEYREKNGSSAYRRCPEKLVRWIWYLWGHWSDYTMAHDRKKVPYDDFIDHGPAASDLAFLMLDPNPKKRITARQLVALLSVTTEELYYRTSIKKKSCSACNQGVFVDVTNLPLHSIYKDADTLKYPKHADDALETKVFSDWESTKVEWLQHHMWW